MMIACSDFRRFDNVSIGDNELSVSFHMYIYIYIGSHLVSSVYSIYDAKKREKSLPLSWTSVSEGSPNHKYIKYIAIY